MITKIIKIFLYLYFPFYINAIYYIYKAYLILGKFPDLYTTEASNLNIGFSVTFNTALFFLVEISIISSFIILIVSIFNKKVKFSYFEYIIFIINIVLHVFIINLGYFHFFTWAMG